MSITYLDYHRPPVLIRTKDGRLHAVSVQLIEDWANGHAEPDKDCLQRIIKEWLEARQLS